MAYFRFEKLEVWQLARRFNQVIYTVTKDFPKDELFSLTSQLRRAATSIMLNIAEGCDRGTDPDYARFLRTAQASLTEVVAGCYSALDQKYISQERFDYLYQSCHIISKKLQALIKSLNV